MPATRSSSAIIRATPWSAPKRCSTSSSGGALTRRLDLGIYPGALGSNTVFLNDSPSARPGGAIVVGLGQVGGLSPGLLEDSLRTALLDFALDVAHWPDKRFGDDGRPRSAAVTCLLIGTGAGGLPVGDALEAILRAAVAANRRLADQELDGRVLIDRLEFLELYEDIAIAAADALSRVLQNETLAAAVRWPAAAVEAGQAGRWRVRFEQAPEWYQRLEIIEDAGRLRFVFTTDRARAEETLATGQLALVDSFVRIASRDTGQNSEVAKTLFEMLLPLRLRELSPQQGNLVVMVDRRLGPLSLGTAGKPLGHRRTAARGRRRLHPAIPHHRLSSAAGAWRRAIPRWSSATPISPARRISPTCPARARKRGSSPNSLPLPITTSPIA